LSIEKKVFGINDFLVVTISTELDGIIEKFV
jgi:hypothetical protein